jgi:hypothetical protein
MSKPWIYYLVAPAPAVESLRDLAVQLGDGGEAERQNFPIPLALASDPTTIVAYGGSTGPVGDATVAVLDAMIDAGQIPPGVSWVRVHNTADPKVIARTSHAESQARIDAGDTVYWDYEKAMVDAGVVQVVSE